MIKIPKPTILCLRERHRTVAPPAYVRDLRNHCTRLLAWIEAGEEIVITRRGKSIARLIPEPEGTAIEVDWSESAAVRRDRSKEPILSAAESSRLQIEAAERW